MEPDDEVADDDFDDDLVDDGDGGADEGDDIGEEDHDGMELSVDEAVASLMRKSDRARGHGPLQRLYRGETRFDFVGRRRTVVHHLHRHHRGGDHLHHPARRAEPRH